MARNNKRSRASNYAKPIPGNTMTVTIPIQDTFGTIKEGGVTLSATYSEKAISVNQLVRMAPLMNLTQATSVAKRFLVDSVKLASVTVAGADAKAADGIVIHVNPLVKFANGLQYEGSGSRILKCRPAAKGPLGEWTALKFGGSVSNPTMEIAGTGEVGSVPTTAFTYRGELKAVTLVFRLKDVVDPDDSSVN